MNVIYQISLNWFVVYYFSLGVILLMNGFIWFRRPEHFAEYLKKHAEADKRPVLVLKTLRYLMLFSGVSLFLSLVPFSVVELVFSVWCLLMLFIIGSILLKWEQLKTIILENPDGVVLQTRKSGLMMISISVVMFLLCWYRVHSWGFA